MCGIAGIIDFAGRPVDAGLLHDLCHDLKHRGPDDRGIWLKQTPGFSVGLAHTRLAVIDPTPEGHQPMIDPSGQSAIVYNGELYNYRDLREQLPGPFRTSCDTEVALSACMQWGPECSAAFRRHVGHGLRRYRATDRPPLSRPDGHQAALLGFPRSSPGLRQRIARPVPHDPTCRSRSISRPCGMYLTLGWIPHPYTIYRDVCKLPPGHCIALRCRWPRGA